MNPIVYGIFNLRQRNKKGLLFSYPEFLEEARTHRHAHDIRFQYCLITSLHFLLQDLYFNALNITIQKMILTTQMLTVLGTICLLCVNGITSSADENVSPNCIEPIEYILNISAEVQKNSLIVDSLVKLNVQCPLQTIKVYFGRYCEEPKINIMTNVCSHFSSLFWETKVLPFFSEDRFKSLNISFIKHNSEHFKIQQRIVNVERGLWISANYNCTLNKVMKMYPFIKETKKKRKKYLILPRIPAEWIFPCWDNLAIKAAFTIRIKHTSSETALSNIRDKQVEKSQVYTYTLFRTPLISTHVVATVVVPSECTNFTLKSDTLIIHSRLQVKNEISYARRLISHITRFIKLKRKDVTPISHVQYIALSTNYSYETIVTTGLVLFRDADIAYNKESDSFRKKLEVTCLVARSVIQEAFSNWLLTLKQSDSWFIEGFLTFYGVYLVDQIYSETLLMSIVVQTRRMVFEYTQAFTEYYYLIQDNPFFKIETFDKMWKERGFNIFYMMNNLFSIKNVLNDFIFEKAIHLYNTSTSKQTYKEHFTLDSLWNNITFVPIIYNNMYFKNIHIKHVITSWITQYGYPVVRVKRDNNTQLLEIMIQDCVTVKQKNMCAYKWWIPITYVKISRKTFSTTYLYLKPDGKSNFLANIEEDDYIIITEPNGYRVNYDRKSLENIALFLKSEKSEIGDASNLSDVTLAQILDDAFYFLIQNTKYTVSCAANSENLDIFFNLASNVVRVENSYIVWHSIFTTLQYISKSFPFLKNAKIKTKVLEILNSFLEDISYKNVSENTVSNQVYYEVLKWTCTLGGLKCKDYVNAILQWHLENPVHHRLLPSWQKWIYCQGLILENGTYTSDLWQNIEKIYVTQRNLGEMFELSSCSGHNILQSLRLVNLQNKRTSINILLDSIAKYSKDVTLLKSIIHKIRRIARQSIIDNLFALITFIINNTYSEENLEKIIDLYFEELSNMFIIMEKTILVKIREKVKSRRRMLNRMKML
ncbi:aminopeptidase N-like [Pseudomyrmex gracilis]|uniref:aminopeptidase N-like n=1 Tax=Pseudomyrmex gracilis TaxID=219809 RepID=UPI000994BBB7|nr:aminopeptidase N-like [Pseudomyrmex gracilis]